jgi:hypothetical protein
MESAASAPRMFFRICGKSSPLSSNFYCLPQCILDDSLRTVTAAAREDVTLALITQENLDKLIDTNPELGARLLKGMLLTVSSRLRQSFDRLAVFF